MSRPKTSSRSKQYTPYAGENPPACAVEGCPERGLHRAPKSPKSLNDYHYLCLEHIQAFNRQWDYFAGMDQDEIESFMKDAVTGHRPTWQRESHFSHRFGFGTHDLNEHLQEFLNQEGPTQAPAKRLPYKERKALEALELDHTCTFDELKAHYRNLVKRYHPDLHGGSAEHEEKFKQITTAYAYLSELYQA